MIKTNKTKKKELKLFVVPPVKSRNCPPELKQFSRHQKAENKFLENFFWSEHQADNPVKKANANRPTKGIHDDWRESFVQLFESLDRAQLNAELEPVTARAFRVALKALQMSYDASPNLSAPDVILSGDGGIDIEWSAKDKLVSVRIRKSDDARDRIYSQDSEDFGSVEFNEENLKSALSQLL